MKRIHSVVFVSSALLLFGTIAHAQDVAESTGLPGPQTVAAPAMKSPRTSNKWRIRFDESSKSDGTITFRVWTQGSTTVDVLVSVRDNQSENAIARAARDAFRKALGSGYNVETDDGEYMLTKASGETPHFSIAIASSTAKDVHVELDRE